MPFYALMSNVKSVETRMDKRPAGANMDFLNEHGCALPDDGNLRVTAAASARGLISLVSGALNGMVGTAYGIAVAMFMLAACSWLRPAKYDNAVAFVTHVTNMFDCGANHASSTDKKKPMTPKDKDDGPANRR